MFSHFVLLRGALIFKEGLMYASTSQIKHYKSYKLFEITDADKLNVFPKVLNIDLCL